MWWTASASASITTTSWAGRCDGLAPARAVIAGYARVSRADQNPDLQVSALRAAGCERIWVEHVSGSLASRPELDTLLAQIRPDDVLVVWRLDRLGRSLRHLLTVITDLKEAGAQFKSLTEGMDTTTANGRLLYAMFGAVAEFERDLNRERTLAGVAEARAQGRFGGRRTVLTEPRRRRIHELAADGALSRAGIGREVGVSRASVYRALRQGPPDAE